MFTRSREPRVTEGGGRVQSAVPCGEGLRPNGGHSPYFAFGDDTYRHGRTTRTDPHGPAQTRTDLTDLTDTHGYSRILTDTHGSHGSHGLSRTLTDSHGLSRTLTDLTDLTDLTHGSHRFPQISRIHTDLTDLTDVISSRAGIRNCVNCHRNVFITQSVNGHPPP